MNSRSWSRCDGEGQGEEEFILKGRKGGTGEGTGTGVESRNKIQIEHNKSKMKGIIIDHLHRTACTYHTHHTIPHYITPHHTTSYDTILHDTLRHHMTPYDTIRYGSTLQFEGGRQAIASTSNRHRTKQLNN